MSSDKFMFRCDLCGSEYQMGPHRYNGKQCLDMILAYACHVMRATGWLEPHI